MMRPDKGSKIGRAVVVGVDEQSVFVLKEFEIGDQRTCGSAQLPFVHEVDAVAVATSLDMRLHDLREVMGIDQKWTDGGAGQLVQPDVQLRLSLDRHQTLWNRARHRPQAGAQARR